MVHERWFPAKYQLSNGSRLGQLLSSGSDWQIYRLDREHTILIVQKNLADRWIASNYLPDTVLELLSFNEEEYRTLPSGSAQRLESVTSGNSPNTKADALSFALSFHETRNIDPEVPLHDAIYAERYSRLLPTWAAPEGGADEVILGQWLTGGVSISVTSFRRLSNLLGWTDKQGIEELIKAAGLESPRESGIALVRQKPQEQAAGRKVQRTLESPKISKIKAKDIAHSKQFHLSGRPTLAAFFNDHVIDIVNNKEQYQTLGIEFPTAIVLHGPPGCGKTFAVEKLGEYLDWPIFHVDPNSVGSPYIHETSRKIGNIFDKAIDNTPSMIVIDEMESYLSDRQVHGTTGLHHVEEVAEFLRRIPEANKCNVLVIGMTNRLNMIDSAILRRGRFDHIVEVGMPSATEISELIESRLQKVPIEGEIDIDNVAKLLAGRALSDAVFVMREAARLAVHTGKTALDNQSLQKALANLPSNEPKKRSIGFVQD